MERLGAYCGELLLFGLMAFGIAALLWGCESVSGPAVSAAPATLDAAADVVEGAGHAQGPGGWVYLAGAWVLREAAGFLRGRMKAQQPGT